MIKVHKMKEAEVLEPEISVAETSEIALLEQTFNLSQLDQLKEDYLFLTVKGIEDKEGYKECDSARKFVKRIRTSIQDRYQQIAKGLEDRKKSVKKLADNFIDELKKIELHLAEQQKVIDDEKERLRVEKLNFRLDSLRKFGTLKLSPKVVETMNQAEFEEYLKQVQLEFEAEQKRIAEEEERKRLEAERIQREQQEKAALLQQQKDEQAEQAKLAAANVENIQQPVIEKTPEVKPAEVMPVSAAVFDEVPQAKKFTINFGVSAEMLKRHSSLAKDMTITVEFEAGLNGVVATRLVKDQSNYLGF